MTEFSCWSLEDWYVDIHKNYTFQKLNCNKFCQKIWKCIPTKSNYLKNWSCWIILKIQMHQERTKIWLLNSFLFENTEANALTMNGNCYLKMISDFLWPYLDGINIECFWFQQNGAISYTSSQTIDLLHEKFLKLVISIHCGHLWLVRLFDLTSCDYFLRGYGKSLVYVNILIYSET